MATEQMNVIIFENLPKVRDLLTFNVEISAEYQWTRQVDLHHDYGEPLFRQQLTCLVQLD